MIFKLKSKSFYFILSFSSHIVNYSKSRYASADLEVQLVQLNHCDEMYLKYLIKKFKTLIIHKFLCLDPP